MKRCKPMEEYAWTVDRIRSREKTAGIAQAIDAALDEMPEDFIIKPYLDANRVEVKRMLLTEYNEAETMAMFKEEGRAEGRAEGIVKGVAKGRVEGEAMLGDLMRALISAGRTDDALRASVDCAYRRALYSEFGIE